MRLISKNNRKYLVKYKSGCYTEFRYSESVRFFVISFRAVRLIFHKVAKLYKEALLELNAAYPPGFDKENAALPCRAVVININLGYNSDMMNRCKKLEEYALFIAKIRGYLEEKYPIEDAISIAMDECIEKGILEEILRSHREEVRSMVLTEYDEQAHIKNEREIAREEGRAEGRKEGEEILARLIQVLLEAGRTEDVIRMTSDREYRERLYKEFQLTTKL